MTRKIEAIRAMEILDSRGNPTLRVTAILDNGLAAPPPCRRALRPAKTRPSNWATAIKKVWRQGRPESGGERQGQDRPETHWPGTPKTKPKSTADDRIGRHPKKETLGANAMLGVSMAAARAAACRKRCRFTPISAGPGAPLLPVPMMNILNGGKHADNSVDFQEFMAMPIGAPSFAEALRYGAETFHALKDILHKEVCHQRRRRRRVCAQSQEQRGGLRSDHRGDSSRRYQPGKDIAIALDPAASSFYEDGPTTWRNRARARRPAAQMTALYKTWVDKYPIVSLEDGLAENDWDGFREQTAALGERIQIVGDDIYVTNTKFIARGIKEKSTNAVLIKLNQIGTVTETIEAIELCRKAGWGYVISHRSGETEDAFMADFAVAMGGGQIKTGSACRSERIAKYNRLMEIEAELGKAAVFGL